MSIREGLIPTALGTAVTATGYALKQNEVRIRWLRIPFLDLVWPM